jgi:DNA-binding MarR family transcriptional regulator
MGFMCRHLRLALGAREDSSTLQHIPYLPTCCRIDMIRLKAILRSMRQTVPSIPADTHRPGDALTDLVIEVFRLNGDLLTTGDALVHDLGLTSARWQVLGAIALALVPLPVAHIARNMGLSRQAVQRVVDDMRTSGLVRLEPNPHHRRAMLVAMTEDGEAAYGQASTRQKRWADDLAAGLEPEVIETAVQLLRTLQERLALSADGTMHRTEAAVRAA